ncbi:hypothetical protein C8R44DRAFT_862121 [Mycena epipterygia]|nr:hypothetical protein C8R44DRAFT_862121 [Mycena epipterygia]
MGDLHSLESFSLREHPRAIAVPCDGETAPYSTRPALSYWVTRQERRMWYQWMETLEEKLRRTIGDSNSAPAIRPRHRSAKSKGYPLEDAETSASREGGSTGPLFHFLENTRRASKMCLEGSRKNGIFNQIMLANDRGPRTWKPVTRLPYLFGQQHLRQDKGRLCPPHAVDKASLCPASITFIDRFSACPVQGSEIVDFLRTGANSLPGGGSIERLAIQTCKTELEQVPLYDPTQFNDLYTQWDLFQNYRNQSVFLENPQVDRVASRSCRQRRRVVGLNAPSRDHERGSIYRRVSAVRKGSTQLKIQEELRMAVVNPSASQILQHVVNREPAQRLIGRQMLPRSAPKVVAQAPSKSIPSAVRAHAGVQNLDSLGISTK